VTSHFHLFIHYSVIHYITEPITFSTQLATALHRLSIDLLLGVEDQLLQLLVAVPIARPIQWLVERPSAAWAPC
jgi:hypothetical protein